MRDFFKSFNYYYYKCRYKTKFELTKKINLEMNGLDVVLEPILSRQKLAAKRALKQARSCRKHPLRLLGAGRNHFSGVLGFDV